MQLPGANLTANIGLALLRKQIFIFYVLDTKT